MRNKIYNKKELVENRKLLRNRSTKAEIFLWNYLKSKKILSKKFRRQYSIGSYIVDFYCPEKKLAIEIDGISHYHDKIYFKDNLKAKYIRGLGINLLRFEDRMIFKQLEIVLNIIKKNLTSPFSPP